MDEQRLAELFRDAVGEPPPASFGRDEVVAASERATARRRHALAGGTLLSVAVLISGMVAGSDVLQDVLQEETSTPGQAAREAGSQAAQEADGQATREAGGGAAVPSSLPTLDAQRGAEVPTPRLGSTEAGQARCAPLDDELAAGLPAVLSTRGDAVSGPAGEVPGPCPDGTRAAAVPVPGGTLYVLVVPWAGPPEQAQVSPPDGWRAHTLALDGGRLLVVISIPAAPGQPAPLAGELPDLAQRLAAGL